MNINDTARLAAKLLEEDAVTKKLTRKANADRVAKLRPLLQEVRDYYADAEKRGVAVNLDGAMQWTEWVEKNGKTTLRNVQYILSGGNKNRATSKGLDVTNIGLGGELHSETLDIDEGRGVATVSFKRMREEKYTAPNFSEQRYFSDMPVNGRPKKKNGHFDDKAPCEYIHNVREIAGELDFEAWQPGASDKEILKLLSKQVRDGLRALRLPHDWVAKAFKEDWKQQTEWRKENEKDMHERRSRSAKRAAATRKNRAETRKARLANEAAEATEPQLRPHEVARQKRLDEAQKNSHGPSVPTQDDGLRENRPE